MAAASFRELYALQGRIALVTGATAGLGGAMALALAEAGADVVVHDRSDPPLATAAAIASLGRRAATVCGDMSDPKARPTSRLMRNALERSTASTRSQSSSECSAAGARRIVPALLMRMSTGPSAASASREQVGNAWKDGVKYKEQLGGK